MALTIAERMARVRVKDTKPELEVRAMLSASGVRYRLHRRDLPGTPDIYIARLKLAIFVNGCFWHGHEECRRAALPKTNSSFWAAKIHGNILRDRRVHSELHRLGIEPVIMWGCEAAQFRKICAGIARKWKRAARLT